LVDGKVKELGFIES